MSERITIHFNHSSELYNQFQGDIIEITDKKILFPVKINAANYKCNAILFKNCEFCSTLEVDNVDLKVGLKFLECEFLDDIRFLKVEAKEHNPKFSRDSRNLYFKECTKFMSVSFQECEIGRDVRFYKCDGITKFSVSTSYLDYVMIEKSTVDAISIHRLNTRISFRIHRSTVLGQGRYENCIGDGFSFTNSQFQRDQSIWGCELRSIITNDGTFEEELRISACSISQGHTFSGTVFKQGVSIKMRDDASNLQANIEDVYLQNCDFQGGFEILADEPAGNRSRIKKIALKASSLNKGNITFDGAVIEQVELKGTNVSANITFRNCQIDRFIISHFTNLGKLYFSDLNASPTAQSHLSINKTSLGVAIFLNVDLASYKKIDIMHSHLTDIIFTDVKWFNPTLLNKVVPTKGAGIEMDDIKDSAVDLNILAGKIASREVYRQLKYAATKQGDIVQSLTFQGLEMQLYNQELGQYQLNWNTLGNKIMMWLNKSNDYGNNWIKPVVLLLMVNFLFFFWITISQSGMFCICIASSLEDVKANFEILWKNNGAYWSLLNPVRRLPDVYPGSKLFSGLTIFLDYFSRIIVSYFIFQIISAFRKYSK